MLGLLLLSKWMIFQVLYFIQKLLIVYQIKIHLLKYLWDCKDKDKITKILNYEIKISHIMQF